MSCTISLQQLSVACIQPRFVRVQSLLLQHVLKNCKASIQVNIMVELLQRGQIVSPIFSRVTVLQVVPHSINSR